MRRLPHPECENSRPRRAERDWRRANGICTTMDAVAACRCRQQIPRSSRPHMRSRHWAAKAQESSPQELFPEMTKCTRYHPKPMWPGCGPVPPKPGPLESVATASSPVPAMPTRYRRQRGTATGHRGGPFLCPSHPQQLEPQPNVLLPAHTSAKPTSSENKVRKRVNRPRGIMRQAYLGPPELPQWRFPGVTRA